MSTLSETSTTRQTGGQWRTEDVLRKGIEHTILALRVYLDQNLFCAHDLHDLPHVRAWLLEKAELLAQEPHPRIIVIPLRFETSENGLALEDLQLHRLDLVVVVTVERHLGGPLVAGRVSPRMETHEVRRTVALWIANPGGESENNLFRFRKVVATQAM